MPYCRCAAKRSCGKFVAQVELKRHAFFVLSQDQAFGGISLLQCALTCDLKTTSGVSANASSCPRGDSLLLARAVTPRRSNMRVILEVLLLVASVSAVARYRGGPVNTTKICGVEDTVPSGDYTLINDLWGLATITPPPTGYQCSVRLGWDITPLSSLIHALSNRKLTLETTPLLHGLQPFNGYAALIKSRLLILNASFVGGKSRRCERLHECAAEQGTRSTISEDCIDASTYDMEEIIKSYLIMVEHRLYGNTRLTRHLMLISHITSRMTCSPRPRPIYSLQ